MPTYYGTLLWGCYRLPTLCRNRGFRYRFMCLRIGMSERARSQRIQLSIVGSG